MHPSLSQIFWTFFKIGAFTLGGGYAMIPLIQKEVVDRHSWIVPEEFVELLAIAQSAPGPIALNSAIFVGYKTRGVTGAIITSLGIILPSFIIILLIAILFTDFKNNIGVQRIFKGIRPAVVALIAAPLWNMGKAAGVTRKNIWIVIAVALLIWLLKISPIYIILAAVIGSICWGIYHERRLTRK